MSPASVAIPAPSPNSSSRCRNISRPVPFETDDQDAAAELRPLRCFTCQPSRKFKTKRDLAAHILSKHGHVTLKRSEVTLQRTASFCEESNSITTCSNGALNPRRLHSRPDRPECKEITVTTRDGRANLAAVPNREPLELDFAQGLF